MSKIEKALDRAKQSRGMALVRTPNQDRSLPETSPDNQSRGADIKSSQRSIARKVSKEAIARMKETALRTSSDLASVNIISPDGGDNPTVQAFREIRTRILQQTQGENAVVLVTSASGGGGGSFVARNLAVAFAFDAGRTSLLVDCDFRNPSLQVLLKDQAVMGITDYLEKPEVSINDIIHPIGIERLRIIPAGSGHHTPTEYFMSERAHQFFAEVRNRYPDRFVFLDAPPILESADARIMAELCDYVLLVIPYAKLTNTQIDNCIKSIDGNKLIGIVFNDEPQLPPVHIDAQGVRQLLKENLSATLARIRQFLRELIKSTKHT